VCNLCCEAFVVHEEKVDFPHIVDQEFFKAVGKKMASLLVAPISNLVRPFMLRMKDLGGRTNLYIPWA
jgi:hypothetical protein